MKIQSFIIFLVLFVACNFSAQQNFDFEIILPRNPTETERYSSDLLQKSILEKCGRTISVKKENTNLGKSPKIYLGETVFSKDFKLNEIDEILIKKKGVDIIVKGYKNRGLTYAVNDFIENNIGIVQLTNTVKVKKKSNLYRETNNQPHFIYRSNYGYYPMKNKYFSNYLRLNGDFMLGDNTLGKNDSINGFVHTFDKYIPITKYFKTHPEWFPDPENNNLPCTSKSEMPHPQHTQLCLTNTELQKEFLKNLKQNIAENPGFNIFSVSQNDNANYCNCSKCRKIIKEEGNASGLLLRFVNSLSEEINKSYNGKKIETLMYAGAIETPKMTKPNKNVIIRLALIENDTGSNLLDPINKDKKRIIDNWLNISQGFYYWDYNFNVNMEGFLMPQPGFLRVGNDLRYLSEKGTKGIFMQSSHLQNQNTYFIEMQTWVLGKLLWNPQQDQKQLIDEFIDQYYQSASPYIKKIFYLVESSMQNKKFKLIPYNKDYSYLDYNTLKEVAIQLTNANQFADNELIKERVEKLKRNFDYANFVLKNQNKVQAQIEHQDYNYDTKSEYDKLVSWISKTENNSEILEYLRKIYQEYQKVDAQTNKKNTDLLLNPKDFQFYEKGKQSGLMQYSNSMFGEVAYLKGTPSVWGIIAWPTQHLSVIKNKKSKLTAYVKIIPQNKNKMENITISMGVYNYMTKKDKAQKSFLVKPLVSQQFVPLVIRDIEFNEGDEIWFTVDNGCQCIDRLLIEKISINLENAN